MAPAAQNVANTNQKGSLLIFPTIEVNRGAGLGQSGVLRDTLVMIGNENSRDVWIKCYWVDENQNIEDFMFHLTANQPVSFSAYDGEGAGVTVPPFNGTRGELKCWAVNASGDQQISYNHLHGNAVVFDTIESEFPKAFEYNAWSFTARSTPMGTPVGNAGNLQLKGLDTANKYYDACPLYLTFNFIPAEGDGSDGPKLTLVPCKQDLRQDRTPTCTKAKFDVWNANESKFTGAYQCIKCWYEGFLGQIGKDKTGYGGDKFTGKVLKTEVAQARVSAVASTECSNKFPGKCTGGQVDSPIIGVIAYEDLQGSLFYGTTPHGAGSDGSGFILWDAAGDTPDVPAR